MELIQYRPEGHTGRPPCGRDREKPFHSASLGLITMMMFLSPKGWRHEWDFEYTDIFLDLGENQLW